MRDAQSAADAQAPCATPLSPKQAEQRRYVRGLVRRSVVMVAVVTVVPFTIWRSAMADSNAVEIHATHAGAAAGLAFSKLAPAGLGAAIMVAVDMPKTRGEFFARFFVAFACSHLFGDFALAVLQGWIPAISARVVDGSLGALGYFLAGGVSVLAKRFKRKPLETARAIRREVKGEQ